MTAPGLGLVETRHDRGRTRCMKHVARLFAFLALLPIAPAVAWGQETPAAAATGSQGHMVVERVENGFLIAPDARFTEVDGKFGYLMGVYGGWMMERTLLIGAGGSWLTNGSGGREMGYGGAVVEWMVHGDQRFAWSARALIGGGSATLSASVVVPVLPYPLPGMEPFPHRGSRDGYPVVWPVPPGGASRTVVVRVHDDFFVAEPQLNVGIKVNRWLHVSAGGGYRIVAGAHGLDDRLHGFSGSLSLQFGGGY